MIKRYLLRKRYGRSDDAFFHVPDSMCRELYSGFDDLDEKKQGYVRKNAAGAILNVALGICQRAFGASPNVLAGRVPSDGDIRIVEAAMDRASLVVHAQSYFEASLQALQHDFKQSRGAETDRIIKEWTRDDAGGAYDHA